MSLETFIRAMPKVELHVHMTGATRPETLLMLAKRNGIDLPAQDLAGMREFYKFRDADHFFRTYDLICSCFHTVEDVELAMREFIAGQATQNIIYTEMTYTRKASLPASLDAQMEAINRARTWGEEKYGVKVGVVLDIPRDDETDESALRLADWAIRWHGKGVVAFGLGGPEHNFPARDFTQSFERALAAGMPSVPHAGETDGPASIRDALDLLGAVRIGHGVRCIEDPALMERLRKEQIPLEVCPTSNIYLGVYPEFAAHPLPQLLQAGLLVTVNSDDPPMFNTTLTDEYLKCVEFFDFDANTIKQLVMNAVEVALLPPEGKDGLRQRIIADFAAMNDPLSI